MNSAGASKKRLIKGVFLMISFIVKGGFSRRPLPERFSRLGSRSDQQTKANRPSFTQAISYKAV